MLIKNKFVLGILVALALLAFSGQTRASVMARAAMTINDLRFSSLDPLAELIWTDVWRGEVLAQAQDSLSGTDAESAEIFGNDASLAVSAATQLATSVAEYQVVNGSEVAKGDGEIEVITGTGLEICCETAQASGEANGAFDNFFSVTGGPTGNEVAVTFELDFIYLFDASADAAGFYDVFAFASLELLGLDNLLIVEDFVLDMDSGTNDSIDKVVEGTLVVDATLAYDESYFLFAGADSEVRGTKVIPEPNTTVLTGLGLFLLLLHRIRPLRRLV